MQKLLWPFFKMALAMVLVLALCSCDTSPKHKISTSCNNTIDVSAKTMSKMSEVNHLQDPHRCPGFFAELPDDDEYLKAQNTRSTVDENSCGEVDSSEVVEKQKPLADEKRAMVESIVDLTDHQILHDFVEQMSRPVAKGGMWDSRFHNLETANLAPEWIKAQADSFVGTKKSSRLVEHTNTPQKSVEVLIPSNTGSDKFLILGAHLDSTNRKDKTHAPGANDNASGSAVLLETLRVLLKSQFQPKVNIVFYWYAAEEIGLVGSQEIARTYAENEKEVLGVMNIDMAFFSPRKAKSISLIRDYTSRKLNTRIRYLAQAFGFRPRYTRCGYACSDHASWTRYGFPSFFARDANKRENFRRIHTLKDILDDKLSAKEATRFVVLAIAYIVDFGT